MMLPKINSAYKSVLLLMLVLTISSYMIPLIYAYLNSDFFTYVNAWDEETYLTYQGAVGLLNSPNYFVSAYITLLFQNIGISGSIENMLFDVLLIPLMVYLLYILINKFINNKLYSFLFAVIILFSSVLVNYSNPILSSWYPVRDIHFIMFGHESYASILRTPNPQLSYFLLLVCVSIYIKYKKMIFLFIPLPFLYFYVVVPYFYFLFIYIDIFYLNKRLNIKTLLISNLKAYFLIVIGLMSLDIIYISHVSAIVNNSFLYKLTRDFFLPLDAIITSLLLIIQIYLYRQNKQLNNFLLQMQITILFSFIAISNFQLLTGYILSYKNYYDYSFSIIFGASLSVFIYTLLVNEIKSKYLNSIVILLICGVSYLNFTSQHFNFSKMQYTIYMGASVPIQTQKVILKNPLNVIIDSADYRAKIAYGKAKTIVPLFSYQYMFPFIGNQCNKYKDIHQNTIKFIKKTSKNMYNDKLYEDYFTADTGYTVSDINDKEYCKELNYTKNMFYIVNVNNNNRWKVFPSYN